MSCGEFVSKGNDINFYTCGMLALMVSCVPTFMTKNE